MKTAIVILNYNGQKFLEKFLPSVITSAAMVTDSKIIVADNASTDDSLPFLAENYPDVQLLTFSKNYGFAGGYNQAISKIDAEYIVLLNSDVEVSNNWLQPLVSYMDQHPEVAACQPKILSYHNQRKFEYAGAAGGFIDYLGYPFCRGRIFATTEEDYGQYDTITPIFWASGACLFIRRKDYLAVGGLDKLFFAHMEEIDLCWRLQNNNRKIVYIPESNIFHVGGGTLKTSNPKKTYLNFRNNLLMLYKNLPQKDLKKILFWRRILDGIAIFQYFIHFDFQNIKSIISAHQDFRKMKSNYASFRTNTTNEKSTSFAEIYPKSIVFQYFILQKKKYSDL